MKLKNKLLVGSSLVAAMLIFSGCGADVAPQTPVNAKDITLTELQEAFPGINVTQEDINLGNILFSGASGDYSMFSLAKQNNHIRSGIQKAALDTLKSNKKYFEVLEPNTLANKNISTYEEFSNECLSNNPLGGGDPCDITNSSLFLRTSGIVGHFMDNKAVAKLLIKVHDVKPNNVKVFDAKEVLEAMKAKDELQENAGEYK